MPDFILAVMLHPRVAGKAEVEIDQVTKQTLARFLGW